MSFGRYLRRARELREISLEEVARATRIPRPALEALERDDALGLPEPVFVRAYVRSVAQHLGLDADDLLLRWEEHTGPVGDVLPSARSWPRWALAAAGVVVVGFVAWFLAS